MMTIDQWLWSGAMILAGLLGGMAINTRRIIGPSGKTWVYLSVMPWTRAQRALYLAVGTVSVLGAVMTARTSAQHAAQAKQLAAVTTAQHEQIDRQQACNTQLIAAINARAAVTSQDATNLSQLLSGVGALVLNSRTTATDVDRQKFKALFANYLAVVKTNDQERQSHSLPSPDCGK